MSQGFKLKYDQMRESNPVKNDTSPERSNAQDEYYTEESNARNICFVWVDGKKMFLNYGYIVSAEYLPQDNTITLTFTTMVIVLRGINLEGLFYDLMRHRIQQISCRDARYNIVTEKDKFTVNEIEVKPNSQ